MTRKELKKISSAKTALLIIDMQNDFTEPGAIIEVPGIRKAFPKFNKLIKTCRKKGVQIFFTRHCFSPKGNPVEAWLFPELEREGLRKGTHGHEVNGKLYLEKGDKIIDKTRYDAFFKTNLEKILRAKKITDLIIIGTMTNACCESTARGAMYRDFNVWFVSDLNFTFDRKMHLATLKNIKSHFGRVNTSGEVTKMLSK